MLQFIHFLPKMWSLKLGVQIVLDLGQVLGNRSYNIPQIQSSNRRQGNPAVM